MKRRGFLKGSIVGAAAPLIPLRVKAAPLNASGGGVEPDNLVIKEYYIPGGRQQDQELLRKALNDMPGEGPVGTITVNHETRVVSVVRGGKKYLSVNGGEWLPDLTKDRRHKINKTARRYWKPKGG